MRSPRLGRNGEIDNTAVETNPTNRLETTSNLAHIAGHTLTTSNNNTKEITNGGRSQQTHQPGEVEKPSDHFIVVYQSFVEPEDGND